MIYEKLLNSAQRKIDGILKMNKALENFPTESEKRAYSQGIEKGLMLAITFYGDLEHCVDSTTGNGLDDTD